MPKRRRRYQAIRKHLVRRKRSVRTIFMQGGARIVAQKIERTLGGRLCTPYDVRATYDLARMRIMKLSNDNSAICSHTEVSPRNALTLS